MSLDLRAKNFETGSLQALGAFMLHFLFVLVRRVKNHI